MDFTGLVPSNFLASTTQGIVSLMNALSAPIYLLVSIICVSIIVEIFVHRKK